MQDKIKDHVIFNKRNIINTVMAGATVITLIAAIILFGGCGTLSQSQKSACVDVPEDMGSVICDVAKTLDVSPEYISYLLKIGNVTALATDTYTAQKAMTFVEELDLFLNDAESQGLAYAAVIQYAKRKYKELPEKVQIAFVVLQEFVEPPEIYQDQPLTKYDYIILHSGLNEQYNIIRPFLVKG